MKKGLIIFLIIFIIFFLWVLFCGILIYSNKTSSIPTEEQIESLAKNMLNYEIEGYLDKDITTSKLKQLLLRWDTMDLDILLNGKEFDVSDLKNLKEDAKYNIDVEYDEEGYINKVIVEEVAEEIKETYDKIDDKILEDYLFTIRNVALNTPCNKIYVYKDGTYIIEKAFWTDLESNILSKGDISNLGNMNDLLSKLEKDSKEHQDSEYGYELTKRGNIKMYVSINNETLQSILSATKYGGGVLH